MIIHAAGREDPGATTSSTSAPETSAALGEDYPPTTERLARRRRTGSPTRPPTGSRSAPADDAAGRREGPDPAAGGPAATTGPGARRWASTWLAEALPRAATCVAAQCRGSDGSGQAFMGRSTASSAARIRPRRRRPLPGDQGMAESEAGLHRRRRRRRLCGADGRDHRGPHAACPSSSTASPDPEGVRSRAQASSWSPAPSRTRSPPCSADLEAAARLRRQPGSAGVLASYLGRSRGVRVEARRRVAAPVLVWCTKTGRGGRRP